jgi:Family of unknown function (DUF5906)
MSGKIDDPQKIKEMTDARVESEKADAAALHTQSKTDWIVADFNKKHAGIMVGGKFRVLNETIDPITGQPEITLSSVYDFSNLYSNKRVGGDGPPYAAIWLDSPKRRQYSGFVFSPGGDVPGYYNLFKGLAVEPKEGDCSLFKAHILNVICGGDHEIYKWVMAWMADLVQNIGGERPGTAIVLRGKQGTGKGCFATQLGAIFGSHFLQITQHAQLTGRFNIHLKSALLVYCDEAIWGGYRKDAGILKGLITEERLVVEPKGVDLYQVENHMRFIIATNSDWAVPAGLEERRFLVLDVSDEHQQDHTYFKAIFEQMDNGGREALLYELMNLNISGVNLAWLQGQRRSSIKF